MEFLAGLVDADMLRTTLVVATPLLLASLGELLLERVGLLNLAIEGMVAVGAAVGFCLVFVLGRSAPTVVAAIVAAAVAVILIGAIFGWLTLQLQANQITVGLALLILGLGASSLLYRGVVGVTTTPPSIGTLPLWRIPLLSDIPYFGRILFQHDLFVYVGLFVIVPVWWVLYRTPLGLRLRATGESPKAVDALGLPLMRLRWSALVAGCALIGIAGSFFPLSLVGGYSDDIASGRGWLALMLVIFGRWRPWTIAAGALLFAWVEALQFQFGVTSKAIPPQFLRMLPYVLAIIVLVRVYGSAQAPAALTKPYDRESRF